METKINFGTYKFEPNNYGTTVTYTAPMMLPKEELDKFSFGQQEVEETKIDSFDQQLKGLLNVPKPDKKK